MITPNQRPWRYLGELYAKDGRPGLLPKMLTVSQLVSIWSASASDRPYCLANTLDQIWFLRDCCLELAKTDSGLARHFADMGMDHFLPWGFRLVDLFEEIFRQGQEPQDLQHLDGDVDPLAATLLGALGRIGALWRTRLTSQQTPLMTTGLEYLAASRHSLDIPEYLRPLPERPVFIAGFSSLDGAEKKLFHSLWQAGAVICLHGDPMLASAGPVHTAASVQQDWIKSFAAKTELYEAASASDPEYSFYAAYDSHSQLRQFVEDFERDRACSAAVVLPSADLLMPVLHHLPDKEINISMGYPLRRSQLHSFLEDLFRLQLRAQPEGKYYWQDLVRIFSQPFLRMLSDPVSGVRLGRLLATLDKAVRSGMSYVSLEDLEAGLRPHLTQEEAGFLSLALAVAVRNGERIGTPGQLASYLSELGLFLTEHGGNAWNRYPLDLEALSRLQNRVLPQLAGSLLADNEFQKPVLFGMLGRLLEQERIPFEADPLVGAQILGLLETRLLNFDTIYLLDASEDNLPGERGEDPLLPDSLRKLAGLPDAGTRQRGIAYNLYRLISGAKRVRFYWSEGAAGSGLESSAKRRSRYIEQLIWAREQALGHQLEPGAGQLRTAAAVARLNRTLPGAVPAGAALKQAMSQYLSGDLSPTYVNLYLSCQARFVYSRLLRLRGLKEVNEGDDAGLVGTFIHQTLASLFARYQGQPVSLADIPESELEAVFQSEMEKMEVSSRLPADSMLVLENAGRSRLRDYLKNQKEETIIRQLEQPCHVKLVFNGQEYNFSGRLDRIDERGGEAVIVDYKTGKLHPPANGALLDCAFFAQLDQYVMENPVFEQQADELLTALKARIPDMQLPLYLLMETARTSRQPADAFHVNLYDSCKEVPLLGDMSLADKKLALSNCASAMGFILAHMERATAFAASGEKCEYCEFADLCRV